MSEQRLDLEVESPAVRVRVADLRFGVTYRERTNSEHVAALAEVVDDWPPLLIFRDGGVLDGAHRLQAARRLGLREVWCTYFDGSREEGLLEFLARNGHRGLGLTLRERRRAAESVLACHPDWSDRRVASLCGLAPSTVGAVRQTMPRPTDRNAHPDKRLGRDGRLRAVSSVPSETRVLAALRENGDASLRQIAAVAGVSPETVRRCKMKLAAVASDPVVDEVDLPVALHRAGRGLGEATPGAWVEDRALASLDDGGQFLDWFERTKIGEEWQAFVDSVPLSRVYDLADEAQQRAARWRSFATELESRTRR